MNKKETFFNHITEGNTFKCDFITLGSAILDGETIKDAFVKAPLKTMNRHGLIAGTTGSGKSVCINTIILSLLYRHTPDRCKFILIDQSTNGTYVKTGEGQEIYLRREEVPLVGRGIIGLGESASKENGQVVQYICV